MVSKLIPLGFHLSPYSIWFFDLLHWIEGIIYVKLACIPWSLNYCTLFYFFGKFTYHLRGLEPRLLISFHISWYNWYLSYRYSIWYYYAPCFSLSQTPDNFNWYCPFWPFWTKKYIWFGILLFYNWDRRCGGVKSGLPGGAWWRVLIQGSVVLMRERERERELQIGGEERCGLQEQNG